MVPVVTWAHIIITVNDPLDMHDSIVIMVGKDAEDLPKCLHKILLYISVLLPPLGASLQLDA